MFSDYLILTGDPSLTHHPGIEAFASHRKGIKASDISHCQPVENALAGEHYKYEYSGSSDFAEHGGESKFGCGFTAGHHCCIVNSSRYADIVNDINEDDKQCSPEEGQGQILLGVPDF